MRFFVLFTMAATTLACASTKPAEDEKTPMDPMNMPQDDRWVGTRMQIESCDLFIGRMEQCRAATPDEVRGAIDWGMNDTLAQWRARPDDAPELCSMANDKAGAAFSEACPGVFPE